MEGLNMSPELVAAAFTVLLGGNIFFVKRLVEKVDSTGQGHESINNNVVALTAGMKLLGDKMTEVKQDIKDLKRIEIDVAVLKAQLNPANESRLTNGVLLK